MPGRGRALPPGYRLRWTARRPPETLPPPPSPPIPQRPTPRYAYLPRWGLRQDFTPPLAVRPVATARWAASMPAVLWAAVAILLIAAATEVATYLLLMLNRTRLVPGWSAIAVDGAALLAGVLAWAAVAAAALVLGCWLVEQRRSAYARLDQQDPRPAWHVVAGCVVPVVGFVSAPLLLLELLRTRDRADGLRLFIRWWWAGWIVLTIVTVGCVAWCMVGGDLQHTADGVAFTAVVDVLAAAFLAGTRVLAARLSDARPTGETADETGTRWVLADR
ncbi:hypothetical protein GCM10023147_46520 [Tsukamurella soli]|uniref:DUF4328 domain-containing protein n=1 Tax=Tsukamurella soli TaxID=644556 RepID=A0ABP8KDC0_9ACTN